MKKSAVKFLVILAIFVLPLSASAAFDINLKYGAKGTVVTELQEFLTEQGYYTGPITGNFFSLTLKGVKAFQTANELPSTGYFGPMSRAKATELIAQSLNESETAEQAEVGSINQPSNTSEVDALKKSFDELKAQQEAEQKKTNDALNQIVQNTAPVVVTPAPVIQEVDKSEIRVTVSGPTGIDPLNSVPYGSFTFKVSVLDKNGKNVNGWVNGAGLESAAIYMNAPNNLYSDTNSIKKYPNSVTSPNSGDWYASFEYIPTTTGIKSVTFTSGNLQKTVTVTVY